MVIGIALGAVGPSEQERSSGLNPICAVIELKGRHVVQLSREFTAVAALHPVP